MDQSPHHPHAVTVTVNNKPVSIPSPHTTGLAIKEAAINQGVAISLTHTLFVVRGHEQIPVSDGDALTVHEHQKFRAVAADDNSSEPTC
ncbi:MAG: hypothetical protein HOO96_19375 [Polyangiaceae bacterium]|nr:hypothetical protein [Polyangiaceae bacterium]